MSIRAYYFNFKPILQQIKFSESADNTSYPLIKHLLIGCK